MKVCSILIKDTNVLQQETFSAIVQAHLMYYTGDQCSQSEFVFEMWLTYDGAANSWLFDQNFVR